jgi:hypothetical protein
MQAHRRRCLGPDPVDLIVLDGRIFDVTDVRTAIGPGSVPLNGIEL